jgi:nicotinamidase-related amidase
LSFGATRRRSKHRKAGLVTVTVIDPKIALIVIDLQKGIVSLPTVHPVGDIVRNVSALADAFRRHRLPVVLVNVDGGAPGRTERTRRTTDFPPEWTDLVPELNRQPQDHLVTKRTWGAFTNTGLEAHLKSHCVTQIVISGVSTSAGVESTARHGNELGFNVVLAVDAMTDMDADAHHNSVARIFPKLGESGMTAEIIDLLETRSAAR